MFKTSPGSDSETKGAGYTVMYTSVINDQSLDGKVPVSLADILMKGRQNNRMLNINSILCYGHERYFQILEGEATAVKSVVKKIKADKRHKNVRVLIEENTSREYFDGLPMKILPAQQASLPVANYLNHYLNTRFNETTLAADMMESLNSYSKAKGYIGSSIKLIIWPRFDIMTPTRELMELCAMISRQAMSYESLLGQNPYRNDVELDQILNKLNKMDVIEVNNSAHANEQTSGHFFNKVKHFINSLS